MRRAHKVDASRKESFFFRKFMAPPEVCESIPEEGEQRECEEGCPEAAGLVMLG
jgi:hypothetical protein